MPNTIDNIQQFFDSVIFTRFNPDAADHDYSYRLNIGQSSYLLSIHDKLLTVNGPQYDGPADVTITINEHDFLDIINGREGIQLLFMVGKISIEGSLPVALALTRLFPLPKERHAEV